MLTITAAVRIFLAATPTDMRRGFDRLAAAVSQELGADPLSGHLFVFRNRRGDKLKILYWDRSGYALWYKRLERGVFYFPPIEAGGVQVESAQLTLILEGLDFATARRRLRFKLPARAVGP